MENFGEKGKSLLKTLIENLDPEDANDRKRLSSINKMLLEEIEAYERKLIRKEIHQNPERFGLPKLNNKPEKSNSLEWFITISLNDSKYTPKKFEDLINLKKFNYINIQYSVIEQRSENPDQAQGFHVHVLAVLTSHVKKSKLIADFYRRFSTICDGKNFIDARPARPSSLRYIQGEKTQEKLAKVKADKEYRDKNNLKHIYTQA